MELDFNLEPFHRAHSSVMRFDLILNELETTHGHIEERIRHLEAVTYRESERQRWRNGPNDHTPLEIATITTGLEAADHQDDEDSAELEVVDFAIEEATEEATDPNQPVNRNSKFLIAKALDVDTDKTESDSEGFFSCNICLDTAKDPILTCCGHLFCWACFYQLSYAYSDAKECPVCRGEVGDGSVIPIYGNGSVILGPSCRPKEKAIMVPPRPHAQRIESVRPRLVRQQANILPIEETLQQFSDVIGVMTEQVQSESPQSAAQRNNAISNLQNSSQSDTLSSAETENDEQTHPPHFSRLLLQGAASLSSLSSTVNSALDSAERLAEELESYIHSRHNGSSHQSPNIAVNRESLSSTANVHQLGTLPADASVENDSEDLPSQSSSDRGTSYAAILNSERQISGSAEIRPTMNPSPSTTRVRDGTSRDADVDDGESRESRRRRLN